MSIPPFLLLLSITKKFDWVKFTCKSQLKMWKFNDSKWYMSSENSNYLKEKRKRNFGCDGSLVQTKCFYERNIIVWFQLRVFPNRKPTSEELMTYHADKALRVRTWDILFHYSCLGWYKLIEDNSICININFWRDLTILGIPE